MSTRQDILLFTFATLKTVDDHCGYSLPFDPLQLLFSNNADYHDIHHQVIGIKKNFSQPFFIHWDAIMGTRMTRKDIADSQAKRDKTISSAKGATNGNGNTNGHVKPTSKKEKAQ